MDAVEKAELNKHGFDRFLRAQLDAVTLVVSCTDTHSKCWKGIIDDALVAMFDLVAWRTQEIQNGLRLPSGDVEEARVRAVVTAMAEGADTACSRTRSTDTPSRRALALSFSLEIVPMLSPRRRTTRGSAVDNCAVGVQAGLVHKKPSAAAFFASH